MVLLSNAAYSVCTQVLTGIAKGTVNSTVPGQ